MCVGGGGLCMKSTFALYAVLVCSMLWHVKAAYVVWNNLIWGIPWSVSYIWLWKFSYYPYSLYWLLSFMVATLLSCEGILCLLSEEPLPIFFFFFGFSVFFLGGAGCMGLRAVSCCQSRCGWCHTLIICFPSPFLFHLHSCLPFPVFHLCFSPLFSSFCFLGWLEVL